MRDLSQPAPVHTAIQDFMAQELVQRQHAAPSATRLEESRGAGVALREELDDIVDSLAPVIVGLSHAIHGYAEVGWEEHQSCAEVARVLRDHGIEPTVGVFDSPTALRAHIGTGDDSQPTIAILCEYDALPVIGHGCGHNVMCANSVGAFLALAELEKRHPGLLPGRVVLQTTPAEECSTAKEILTQRGMLEGIDAAIQTHSYNHDLTHQTWLGVRRMRFVFTGVPAHASSQPFMGRNALDAASLALQGIGLLRQQLRPMDRVHAIITDGGTVPNIIPEHTELKAMIRSKYPETLRDVVARVEDVFRGAALMTGTGLEIIPDGPVNDMPVRDNGPLLESWTRAQAARGRDPLPEGVVSETIAAGTDFGNVSLRVPGIHPLIKVADGDVALHTREMTEAAGGPGGDAAAVDGAYGLGCVALDYLMDPAYRENVHADFEASGGVMDVAHFWDKQ
ncbi:amidohydrolase [Actinomyces vulturis]|uniref:amidohydrolase n=1 Tax=Actinomyces vulturis TaxID=1857645 RepID=UPI000829A970|nr:amidohydrolase [Actinomyces vulturis]